VFVGRADEQVKIRGFRVEPGEIEAALSAHPSVAQAVVAARSNGIAGQALVGYVVPAAAGREVDPVAVREFVAARLPEYMVPSVVVLDELPLTPSGKVNRKALPAPDFAAAVSSREPRDLVEETLCGLFTEVLGLERVGIDDSFFDLGGHSLLAVRLVGRAQSAGLQLAVADVVLHRTVAELAARAKPQEPAAELFPGPFPAVLPIRPTGGSTPLFFVHSGLGFSVPYIGLARYLDPRYPLYGLQAPAAGGRAPLPDDIREVAAEYVRTIRGLWPEGPYRLLGWSYGGVVAHEMAVQLQAAGEQVDFLANLDGYLGRAERDESGQDDRELLLRAMESLGHGREEFAGVPLSPAELVGVLQREKHPLAQLGEEGVLRLLRLSRVHGELMERFEASPFAGRMHLFTATEEWSPDELADLIGRWEPHVEQGLRIHPIPCGHEYLMHPAPQAAVGRVVEAELRRLDGEQGGDRSW
jgi:thioesterase domain-containing protein